MMNTLELGILIQLLSILTQLAVVLVMYLSIKEIVKNRKREFLKKRLDEFYTLLIKLFGHGVLHRDPETHRKVEEVIILKRYLCGRKVARILPKHFTAIISSGEFYFYFSNEYEMKQWEDITDAIWYEYIEVLKGYYKLIGVRQYMLPEKPKWMFAVRRL